MKKILKAGLALGLSASGIGSAFAADCGYVAQWGYYNYHPECNAAAVNQIVTSGPISQMLLISQVLGLQYRFLLGDGPMLLAGGQGFKGLAAGANAPKWNAWANGSYNDTDLSKGSGNALNFDGRQSNFAVGGDYRLSPTATLGLSVAYDDGSIRPEAGGGLKLTNSGYNVAPYVAYQFSKNYSVDASAGIGWGSLKRSGAVSLPADGDTERRFAGVNLNSGHWFGNVQLAGKASLLYSHQHNGADLASGLDEATKYLMQSRLGMQASYWVANGFMPYVSLSYVNDLHRNRTYGAGLDRDGFVAGLGLNYFSRGGVTGGVSYTSEFGRSDTTNNVFMANVNVRF